MSGGRPAFGTFEELPHIHTLRYWDGDEDEYKKRSRAAHAVYVLLSSVTVADKKVDWCRLAGLGWMIHGRDGVGVAVSLSLGRE